MSNDNGKFWQPTFRYETREDGTVLMWQPGSLPPYAPMIADALDHWADAAPARDFLARRDIDGSWKTLTYAETRDAARRIGAGLLRLGLGPDRPLLILSENSLEHGLLGLAATYVGIPYAPVSPAYSLVSKDHNKLKDIAALLQPGAVYADDAAEFAAALQAIAADDRTVIAHQAGPQGAIALQDLYDDPAPADAARAALTPDAVVKYLFTSGSTGSPKAVINTNRMIMANQAMVRDSFRFLTQSPPVVLDWAPWNHTAAGNKVFYLVLTNGGTYYIDDGKPVPGKFQETLRNLRDVPCTWYFNVPAGFDMLVDALEQDDDLAKIVFSRLEMLWYAGAGMAQHIWDRLIAVGRKAAGRDVLLATGLGATETAPFALACTEPQKHAGNVGVPALGLTLKLVPNGGKLEARLKGPSITPGYYGDTAKTAEAFDQEGFYKLGDALRPADPDDFSKGFFFDGRVAENFKLSTGTWVSVGAVRASLVDAMEGLIRDAVIIGENRPELGALVLLSPDATAMPEAELRAALTMRLEQAASKSTGSASRVVRIGILTEEPSFDRGEITEKRSLNQRAMRDHNAGIIKRLYDGPAGVILTNG